MNPSRLPQRRLRLLISMLKGGPGKSTTTWFLAIAFAALGLSVVAIDADKGSRTLSSWYDDAKAHGWTVPFVVEVWRGEDEDGQLSEFMRAMEQRHGAAIFILDTGGERREVFMSACLWADRLLSPCGPSLPEIMQLHQTKKYATEIAAMKEIAMSVLLTRVPKKGKGIAAEARALITDEEKNEANRGKPFGLHVMETEIVNNHHLYSVTYGTVPEATGQYADLAQELAGELIAMEDEEKAAA